jgi:DNA-binding MarR family transcriptional regulator
MASSKNGKQGVTGMPLPQMVTYRLSRLNAQLNSQAVRILKETAGISLTQWRVLVVLDAYGKVPSAEIVRATAVDKGQLSRTLKAMVADGLISSETRESDQRSHMLAMTDRGRAVYERARPAMRDRQARLSAGLSGEERENLFRALDKIAAASAALEEDQ